MELAARKAPRMKARLQQALHKHHILEPGERFSPTFPVGIDELYCLQDLLEGFLMFPDCYDVCPEVRFIPLRIETSVLILNVFSIM